MPPKREFKTVGKRSRFEPGASSRGGSSRRRTPEQLESGPDFNIRWNPDRPDHKARFETLKNRTIVPSRWIDVPTIEELGLHNEVQILTERIGLWDFLCDEVPTYRAITLEFLSTVEISEENNNVLIFQLKGNQYQYSFDGLNHLLGFPTDEMANLETTSRFSQDITYVGFINRIVGFTPKYFRARQIQHPTLRYIQRILAYTLHGRGETSSVPKKPENFFLYCMLYRNNNELDLRPHIGHFLAQHLVHVATENRPNGQISVGGIITKIARALKLKVNSTNAVVVKGPTTLDIKGLVDMSLIRKSRILNRYFNLSWQDNIISLPLQTPLDPTDDNTWRLSSEPIAFDQPDPEEQQEEPSTQMMYDQMTQLGQQMEHLTTQVGAIATNQQVMQSQIDELDDRSYQTWYMAQQSYNWHMAQQHFPNDRIPTPPRQRRSRDQQPPDQ